MEGYLSVPPEKSAILGRAVWKTRYIMLGPMYRNNGDEPRLTAPDRTSSSHKLQIAAKRGLKFAGGNVSTGNLREKAAAGMEYLRILKNKGDEDAISHFPVSTIISCSIEDIAHRKSGAVIPTLCIDLEPEPSRSPSTSKIKRRSSQSSFALAAASASKSRRERLMFRNSEDDDFTIYEWLETLATYVSKSRVASPETLTSPSTDQGHFSISASSTSSRPNTTKSHGSAMSYSKSHSYSQRSESPSIHSVSTTHSKPATSSSKAPSTFPSDLSNPSSPRIPGAPEILNTYTIVSNRSNASMTSSASSPPTQHESILDRAFAQNKIPGFDHAGTGYDRLAGLSSVERFEMIMREMDAQDFRGRRSAAGDHSYDEIKEESGEEALLNDSERARQVAASDEEKKRKSRQTALLALSSPAATSTTARRSPTASMDITPRASNPYQGQLQNPDDFSRRNSLGIRTTPKPSAFETPPDTSTTTPNVFSTPPSKRHSSQSIKRLSFTEFTRRLSATSSSLIHGGQQSGSRSNSSQRDSLRSAKRDSWKRDSMRSSKRSSLGTGVLGDEESEKSFGCIGDGKENRNSWKICGSSAL